MTYASLHYVSRAKDYTDALRIYNNLKPIRGRAEDIRPIGRRKDVDAYSCRKVNDVIEFVLYRSPVIKFHPDNTVELNAHRYMTIGTSSFIGYVLGLHRATKTGDNIVICPTVQTKVLLQKNSTLKLRHLPNSNEWEVLDSPTVYGYRVNRTASNKVRARFSEFNKFFTGFLKLRADEHIENEGTYYESRFTGVQFTANDVMKALSLEGQADWVIDPCNVHQARKVNDDMRMFISWVSNDQPEETKHANFYRAAMAMLLSAYSAGNLSIPTLTNPAYPANLDRTRWANVDNVTRTFEEVIARVHAPEVLVKVALNKGVPPNSKYERWMRED